MRGEWARWCKRGGLDVDGDEVLVPLANARSHRLRLQDDGEAGLRVTGVVAGRAVVVALSAPALAAWRRNRTTKLVGFGMDAKGRLVGECWVPKVGLSEPELLVYLRVVAQECDRLEYLLTGRDFE